MSRLFLQTQTELLDLCLAELAQLLLLDVNFNNTAQFDLLLRHIELSFAVPEFCQVPSVYVLHVLLTLAARCPQSNWSHDPGLGALGSSTEYMRRVNQAYDSSLASLLLQRCTAILRRYMHLAGSLSLALKTLNDNMSAVFLQIGGTPPKKGTKSPVKKSGTKSDELEPDLAPALYAVEVISDLEDSDSPLELPQLQPVPEYKSVISLSELGAKTSGLGEVATLFKDMPHLLAQATPEPDAPTKKRKSDTDLWRRIRVYDDDVLAARIGEYTFWDLVRWTFWLANASLQYQQFLFNSQSTCVHSCYTCYCSVVFLVMEWCALQMVLQTSALWDRLFRPPETAVQIIFLGLVPSREKPGPCYHRELLLLSHDPAVRVSQCKRALDFDDNMHSMALRVSMLTLFAYYGLQTKKRPGDIRSLVLQKTNEGTLLLFTIEEVLRLSVQYTRAFFEALPAVPFFESHAEVFLANTALGVLSKATDVATCVYTTLDESFSRDVADLITDGQLFCGVTEDMSTPSLAVFFERWEKMVFLVEWLVLRAMCRTNYNFVASCKRADELLRESISSFLESRCDDADLIEDSAFTVTRKEMEPAFLRAQCRFEMLASKAEK